MNMLDGNTAALNAHLREMDEADERLERITKQVWEDLANGELDVLDIIIGCKVDTFMIALYEACKDNRPAYATWHEPKHAYRDFYANIEALVENEIELRMSR